MNASRLTYNVLRLSGPLRPTLPACNSVVFCRSAHQKNSKKEQNNEGPRNPINNNIPFEVVQLVNAEGKLESPEPLADVLARVNLTEFYVELVTPDNSLVKIYNKREQRDKAKARDKARKARIRANETKEIQMTWGVAPGDLAHKLDKARKELEKQTPVDLIFAPKSKQPVPPPDQRTEKVAEVLDMLKDVGMERMPRTFKKSLLTIHLRRVDK